MIQCLNCGQGNNYGSNFCRFCGTRMIVPPPHPPQNQNVQQPYEVRPPRPYVWKTDEFQISDANEKRNKQINQVQPLPNLTPPQQHSQHPPMTMMPPSPPAPLYRPQAVPVTSYGYRCPNCGTQNFPYIERKISAAGWIVFAVLLVMFFPLFWVGFLIKEDVKICPVCGIRVG